MNIPRNKPATHEKTMTRNKHDETSVLHMNIPRSKIPKSKLAATKERNI